MGLRARLQEKAAAQQLDNADPVALRDYYQSVLDSTGSVIYTVNRQLRITGVNRGWDDFALANGGAHLTGQHVLGSHLLDQMTGAPLQRWGTVCQQLLDGQLSRYLDEIASDEPYLWRVFSLRATPLRNSDGEIQGITFVASNITQLKKAENEMFRRLVELRGLRQVAQTAGSWVERRTVYRQITSDVAHLFDAEKCVIFLWDENTGHLQAREPAFGLAGRKLSDLALDMGHPADPDSLWLDLEQKEFILLNEGDDAPVDMVETSAQVDRLAAMLGVLRVSARIHGAILVAGRDRPFTAQDGQLLGLFAVPIALSIENSELNRRLLDRAQQLTAAQEQSTQLREAIRMPLGMIRSYLELLRDGAMGSVPEEQLPMLSVLHTKTQTIIDLINTASPVHFPHDATRHEPVNLADLIPSVLAQRSLDLKRANLALVTQLPAAQDTASVTLGDPDILRRVFDALVDNAIQLCPNGGTLCVALHGANGVLHVTFTDSGRGIPADQLAEIWKKSPRPGQPVGLAEVRRIVEGYGGQAWAESAPGKGNTFHVALRRPPLTPPQRGGSALA